MLCGMNIVIVYDSLFGNTEKIAHIITTTLKRLHTVRTMTASQVNIPAILGADLLIVGSPTHGGRPKPYLQTMLDQIPKGSLKHTYIAAFDTRLDESIQHIFLRLLMGTIGYAALKIQALLEQKGGNAIFVPEGFIVLGKKGPLRHGELERAAEWAKKICSSGKTPVPVSATP